MTKQGSFCTSSAKWGKFRVTTLTTAPEQLSNAALFHCIIDRLAHKRMAVRLWQRQFLSKKEMQHVKLERCETIIVTPGKNYIDVLRTSKLPLELGSSCRQNATELGRWKNAKAVNVERLPGIRHFHEISFLHWKNVANGLVIDLYLYLRSATAPIIDGLLHSQIFKAIVFIPFILHRQFFCYVARTFTSSIGENHYSIGGHDLPLSISTAAKFEKRLYQIVFNCMRMSFISRRNSRFR